MIKFCYYNIVYYLVLLKESSFVLPLAVPPSLLLYPSSTRSISSGGEFTATCAATAEPPASIVWLKDGEILLNDGISNVLELTEGNVTTSRLVFGSFGAANSSLYSCMASNFLGNDTASFFVSTWGEPALVCNVPCFNDT